MLIMYDMSCSAREQGAGELNATTITLKRVRRLAAGLVLYGVSIALMLKAGLGVDSWDVFHQGIAESVGITLGWVINGVSLAVLVLWLPLRQRLGTGTVANALVVGIVADLALSVLTPPELLLGRAAMLTTGIVLNGAATGLYIGAGLGPGPRDGLMTGLAAKTGRSLRLVRTGIELAVLLAGWILGGPVGIGTLLYAISIGPLVQFFLPRFAVDASPGKRGPGASLDLEGCPA